MIARARRRGGELSRAKPKFKAYGASAELFAAVEPEILFVGAANTGKTRTATEKTHFLCEEFPGIRVLWVRKTRKSMTESVLVTFEEHVLPVGHPCIHGTAQRANREAYQYPNGSRIVLGGMDNPDRIMSTEYDFIYYFEATEGTLQEWEQLSTRVRNKRIPLGVDVTGELLFWDQMVADCNPGHENHWLNTRAKSGKMRRIIARHCDNPVFTKRDQARLDNLTGTRRLRLRDGKWVSPEGQILDAYDPGTHNTCLRDWQLDKEDPSAGYKFDWYFAGLDFGKRHAQALEVFGVVGEKVVRVCEIYKREKRYDWWGGAIERALDKWDISVIVADNSDLAQIDYLNDRLGPLGGREEDNLVIPTKKLAGAKMRNVKVIEDLLVQQDLFFAMDALHEGYCEVSKETHKPLGLLDELPDWRWDKITDGSPQKDQSDPRCIDHGVDAMLMAFGWYWGRDLTPYENAGRFRPGSMGEFLDHDDVLNAEEQISEHGRDDELWPISDTDEFGNLV